MMVEVRIEDVFNFFMKEGIENNKSTGFSLTESRLHALGAYAYVWYLGLRDKKLFDEKMCMSRNSNGYFFYSQRRKYYIFGRTECSPFVPTFKTKMQFIKYAEDLWDAVYPTVLFREWLHDMLSDPPTYFTTRLPMEITKFLEGIWDCYSRYETFYLQNMQYREATWQKGEKTGDREVKDEWIKECYSPKNEELYKYLPPNVVLKMDDGLYQIVRND
jgi:uncharacterized phage-associated protein